MPLDNTTTTYDLCEERDRLDDQLDELAARSVEHEERFAELQGRAATDDGDDPDDELERELGQLMGDREEHQREVARTNREYNGVVWAVERYGGGDAVVTDGGEPNDATDDAGKQDLYEEMTADEDGDGSPTDAGASGPDQQPQRAVSGGHSGDGPAQSADSPTASVNQQAAQPGETVATSDVTITLGGLTAGEHARVTDRAGDQQAENSRTVVGRGQQGGTVEGASRVFYCAAGLVDAPFIERGAGFEAKIEAVRNVHPGLMIWMESRIDDVNTPSENLGQGWQDRLDHARNNRNENNGTSPPDTNT